VVRALTAAAGTLPELSPVPVPADTAGFRRALLHEMTRDGVPEPEAYNVLVAAGEIPANDRRHGDGLAALRVGRVDGRFVCELYHRGPGIQDPPGYRPPRPGQADGAGVWVASQLTARLDFVSSLDAFATRLWV
jgi:hypothetical protein